MKCGQEGKINCGLQPDWVKIDEDRAKLIAHCHNGVHCMFSVLFTVHALTGQIVVCRSVLSAESSIQVQ